MKILLVDDEFDIRNLVKIFLQNDNYEIIEAEDGVEALEKIDDSFDLVLLDSMMPRLNGVDTCLKMREKFNMPIIFLTAKSEDMDKFTGFSSGADDYITKPFNPIDLISRVKANIRRYRVYGEPLSNDDEIILDDLIVNLSAKTLLKNGEQVKLTKIEFSILELFLKNRKRVFSLDQIYQNVWGEESVLNAESTVSVHIRNLRSKLEDDISNPKYIKTVWGSGYRVD